MERLVLTVVGKPIAFELMPGLNTVGRNPTNDCRVADASISSFHAEVTLMPDNSVRVRDLASTNGTAINGVAALDGELRVGDILRLGTVELSVDRVIVAAPVLTPEPAFAGGNETAEQWTRNEQPQSFLGKLTQTMKIGFKR